MKKITLVLALLAPLAVSTACTSNQQAGAAKGGTRGAVGGAAAGALGALIFGGNVGESAARGAVWAGTAGAVSGTMAGTDQDKREAEQQRAAAEKELRQLRKRIGDDAFQGLGALAECKHEVALAYAETGARSDNRDYAVASIWLRALTYVEMGREDEATDLYPELVAQDKRTDSVEQAQAHVMEVLETIRDYREKEGHPRFCP